MDILEKYRINFNSNEKYNDENWIKEHQDNGDFNQQLFSVSNEILKEYYRAACQIMDEGRLEDALDAFIFLTFLNSRIPNFWMGLGMSYQRLEKYEQALNAYNMARIIDFSNPYAHANAFQCSVALNDQESAEEALNFAIEACADKKEFSELKKELQNNIYKKI